jgi:hypothetical protein
MTDQTNLAQAITEVSERAQLLVREEIELAKVEVTSKVRSLAQGGAVGLAAGGFVLSALLLILIGSALFLWWLLPLPGNDGNLQIFWGFYVLALILLALGALAGFLALKAFKKASPPAPTMAIDEAKKIRSTIRSSDDPMARS